MNYNEYQLAAIRTYPDLGSVKLNSAHMIMGMVSELEELHSAIEKADKVNIGEELTDIHWYLANYCTLNAISYQSLSDLVQGESVSGNFTTLRDRLVNLISALTDLEKKNLAYNKAIQPKDRKYLIEAIIIALNTYYRYFRLDQPQCLFNNIAKLKVRFPDKFTEECANNRNTDKERVVLEK